MVVTATDISWLPLAYYNPGLAPAKYPLKSIPILIFPALVKQLGSNSISQSEAGQHSARLVVVFEVNTPESSLHGRPNPPIPALNQAGFTALIGSAIPSNGLIAITSSVSSKLDRLFAGAL